MSNTIHQWMWHLYDRGFSLANYMLSIYDDSMDVIEYTPVAFFTDKEREEYNVRECIDMIRFIMLSECGQ